MKRLWGQLALVCTGALVGTTIASAELIAPLPFGGEVHVSGAYNGQYGFGIHHESEADRNPGEKQQGDVRGLHYTYQWLDVETDWNLGKGFRIRVNPYLIGDLNYAIFDGKKDYELFENARDNLQFDSSPKRIFSQAYAEYTHRLFQVRFGQQAFGWGESDGLRLADVVNPLDITRQVFLFGEGFRLGRVPETMLRLIVTPGAVNFGESTLLNDWFLEGIVVPQIEPLRVYVAQDGRYGGHGIVSAGGVWALGPLDWQDRTEKLNIANLVTLDGYLPDNDKPCPAGPAAPQCLLGVDHQPHYQWTNPLLGARLSVGLPNGRFTINYVQRIGGFFDIGVVKINTLTVQPTVPAPRPGFDNPVAEASLIADIIYPRKHIIGFTFNYDLGDWVTAPRALGGTSPVLRIEQTYTLGMPVNTQQRVKSVLQLSDIARFPNVTAAAYPNFLQKKDFLQYMVGFDWPLRFEWLNPESQFFTSAQFFHFKWVSPSDKYALQPAKRVLLREDQFYVTLLVFTSYLHRLLNPTVLAGVDANTGSSFVKPSLIEEIGDHWRIEQGMIWFNRGNVAPLASLLGAFDRRTDLYIRIGYQF